MASNGKKVFPDSGTVGQYIPEHVAQEQWLKGGIRVEPTLKIRQGSPNAAAPQGSIGIMKPNAAIHNSNFDRVNIGPAGPSSMPENVSNQLQNDMRTLLNEPGNSIDPATR